MLKEAAGASELRGAVWMARLLQCHLARLADVVHKLFLHRLPADEVVVTSSRIGEIHAVADVGALFARLASEGVDASAQVAACVVAEARVNLEVHLRRDKITLAVLGVLAFELVKEVGRVRTLQGQKELVEEEEEVTIQVPGIHVHRHRADIGRVHMVHSEVQCIFRIDLAGQPGRGQQRQQPRSHGFARMQQTANKTTQA
mmetsp:Transcript_28706/g.59306  ORF Transcript_28706/g.59306 Transcript_28706/m.59306 type:complete len:201 (-) Transcript_28706:21-623(-)